MPPRWAYSPVSRTVLVRNGQHGDKHTNPTLPLIVWRDRAREQGWSVVEGLAAFAQPAGGTTRSTYEALRDEILADLRKALPVDAVLLNLHGAMIADGYLDAEGDLLAAAQAPDQVAQGAPVVELDEDPAARPGHPHDLGESAGEIAHVG